MKLKQEKIKIYTNKCFTKISLNNTINGIIFFRKLINQQNIDVVNVQTIYHLIIAFISSRFLFRRKKVKILYTMHYTFFRSPAIVKFFVSCIINFFADLAIFVANNPINKLTNYGLLENKVRVIHNGIDIKLFDHIISHKLNSTYRFLEDSPGIIISYCASLIPRKGHKYLIRAVSKVSRVYPNIKLIFTSDGPLKKELITLTKIIGISEKVYFLGRVSYEELYMLLNITDIYVFPSLSELFPYAILEAMAANKPIIATDVGGISEAIIHEWSGILVPSGSSEALCKAIIDLIKKPEKANKLGKNARELIEQKFEVNHIANQYISLYYRIMQ